MTVLSNRLGQSITRRHSASHRCQTDAPGLQRSYFPCFEAETFATLVPPREGNRNLAGLAYHNTRMGPTSDRYTLTPGPLNRLLIHVGTRGDTAFLGEPNDLGRLSTILPFGDHDCVLPIPHAVGIEGRH